jgi:hypothetical protein
MEIAYFSMAIFMSHFIYKKFKNMMLAEGQMMMVGMGQNQNNNP